jgi:hypothetical protein
MMADETDEYGRKKWFYVDAIDGRKTYLIAGPFASHQAALDLVDEVRSFACDTDGRAHFMAWGTCSNINFCRTAMGKDPAAYIAQHSKAA